MNADGTLSTANSTEFYMDGAGSKPLTPSCSVALVALRDFLGASHNHPPISCHRGAASRCGELTGLWCRLFHSPALHRGNSAVAGHLLCRHHVHEHPHVLSAHHHLRGHCAVYADRADWWVFHALRRGYACSNLKQQFIRAHQSC